MARAIIDAGVCGFTTIVDAEMDGDECVLKVQSACASIQRLAQAVQRVDPLREISHRGDGSEVLKAAMAHCRHTACPVPAGIVKTIEVAAGLALPRDAAIKLSAQE